MLGILGDRRVPIERTVGLLIIFVNNQNLTLLTHLASTVQRTVEDWK